MKRFLGPAGAYYLSIILGIIAYRVPRMTIRWEGQEVSERTWVAYVANVERTGGGSLCIAPGVRPDDGELRVVIMPAQSKWNFLTKNMHKVASGQHVKEPGVLYFPAREVDVECDQSGIVEVDGDVFGNAPAKLAICPNAVKVICPVKSDGKTS